MAKTTKELNAEIAKLRAAARLAEKTEYEDFGRWVVDHLTGEMKGAPSERIDAARERLSRVAVDHRAGESVNHTTPSTGRSVADEEESLQWSDDA